MRELFIYYQARVAHTAALQAAVQAMQQRLRTAHPGLQTRLLRRADDTAPGCLTWMETYASAAEGGVGVGLQAQIAADAAQALGPWLLGPRHTEAFVACA